MFDLLKSPSGADTLMMNLGAVRGADVQRWRSLWRAGLRSVAASAVTVAIWMMWHHGDGRDAVAAGAVTMISAMVCLSWPRSRSPSSDQEPRRPPDALPEIVALEVADAGQPVVDDDLRQAEKMETIGRCVGEFAHDFNNLLTVILCNVDRASRSAVPGSRAFAYLADACRATRRRHPRLFAAAAGGCATRRRR